LILFGIKIIFDDNDVGWLFLMTMMVTRADMKGIEDWTSVSGREESAKEEDDVDIRSKIG
jgi:hypothetical protein